VEEAEGVYATGGVVEVKYVSDILRYAVCYGPLTENKGMQRKPVTMVDRHSNKFQMISTFSIYLK